MLNAIRLFRLDAGAHARPIPCRRRNCGTCCQIPVGRVFTLDVPPEVIVRDKATIKERVAVYQKVFKMVSEIESQAFYDGHYLAFGFGAGSCRHTFCGQQETAGLEGKKCRFSRSLPSRRGVGIDVYQMVSRQGWDISPSAAAPNPPTCPRECWRGL